MAFSKQLSKEINIPFLLDATLKVWKMLRSIIQAILLIDYNSLVNKDIIKQASKRFGANKIIIVLTHRLQDKQDETFASEQVNHVKTSCIIQNY